MHKTLSQSTKGFLFYKGLETNVSAYTVTIQIVGSIAVTASTKHKRNKQELNPLYTYIKETEKCRKKEYERFLEKTSESLEIPKDVIAGEPIIRMNGNHGIHICNYNSVAEYTTERIRLSIRKKNLNISGSHLLIKSLRKEEIIIVGNITNISFEGTK